MKLKKEENWLSGANIANNPLITFVVRFYRLSSKTKLYENHQNPKSQIMVTIAAR